MTDDTAQPLPLTPERLEELRKLAEKDIAASSALDADFDGNNRRELMAEAVNARDAFNRAFSRTAILALLDRLKAAEQRSEIAAKALLEIEADGQYSNPKAVAALMTMGVQIPRLTPRVDFMFGNHTFKLCETIPEAMEWLDGLADDRLRCIEMMCIKQGRDYLQRVHGPYPDVETSAWRARLLCALKAEAPSTASEASEAGQEGKI